MPQIPESNSEFIDNNRQHTKNKIGDSQSNSPINKLYMSLANKYTQEDLISDLKVLFDSGYASREDLRSLLLVGDRLQNEEFEFLFNLIPFENNVVSIQDFVEVLMRNDWIVILLCRDQFAHFWNTFWRADQVVLLWIFACIE